MATSSACLRARVEFLAGSPSPRKIPSTSREISTRTRRVAASLIPALQPRLSATPLRFFPELERRKFLRFPFNIPTARTGATTYVRAGIVGGKEITFLKPAWDTTTVDGSQDFGTDGGVHNFLRFLER